MFVISRFADADPQLVQGLHRVAEHWRNSPGCEWVEVVHNLDQQGLWALLGRWRDVGSYRRSFAGHEAKMLLTPVLLRAVDEPSAYLREEEFQWAPDKLEE
ncbi:MAG: antibiotic biosynthesis monooxygenase [Propionibacteriaceae bacterium]|nr:antibiotic biosynthesis monooxygenase [Propionibacteriaceae bacterium]